MEGVFAAGDIVSGAKTVVEAVNNSKIVAENIHNVRAKSRLRYSRGRRDCRLATGS